MAFGQFFLGCQYLGKQGWSTALSQAASHLKSRDAIPTAVVHLLEATAEAEPERIVSELRSGRLVELIRSLDPTALLLAIETVQELIQEHERLDHFREAAAMDILADRLRDSLATGVLELSWN